MSLDATPTRLVQFGEVKVSADGIEIEGFDGVNVSCRDVASLALVWAIGRLQEELERTIQAPGLGRASVN